MQITPEELHRHYESLSDEELREIDPNDLTELARKCYEQAFQNRFSGQDQPGVDAQEGEISGAESLGEEGLDAEPDWLESAACPCSYSATPGSYPAPDAAHARDVLLAAGIPCHLSIVEADPRDENAPKFDEYRVLVPQALNLKAVSVLDQEIFNPELEADWRTHLATLTDSELQALKPQVICAGLLDRVRRLQKAYEEEITRRRSNSQS
jgi:hypothetical protein